MKIFKDIISGDELFSDTFPMKLVDDLYYEVEGKRVVESTDVSDAMIGGNASAEGCDEDAAASGGVVMAGIDVVVSHRLEATSFNKKTYQGHIKEYMKAVKEHLKKNNPSRVDAFVAGAPAVVKMILSKLGDYDFYNGTSMNPEAMAIPMNYREDGVTPYFIFFKDGLEEEKC